MVMMRKGGWPRRYPKLLALSLIILVSITVLVLIARSLNSPATGTIESPMPDNPKISTCSAPCDNETLHAYSGQAISFSFPKGYRQTQSQKGSGILDSVFLISSLHSKTIAVSVVRESLANDSGVNFRRGRADIYKETDQAGRLVFTKSNQDGAEYTAYLTHNDLVASISLTSPYPVDLSADYQTIDQSWQWK